MGDLPEEKEELEIGEILYQKVEKILAPGHVSNIGLITGMLLERSRSDLVSIIADEQLLIRSIEVAVNSLSLQEKHLLHSNGSTNTDHVDNMADILFDKVSSVEPSLAPFITGMILELDPKLVAEILSDEHQLQQAVEKARKSFLDAKGEETSSLSLPPADSNIQHSNGSQGSSTLSCDQKEEEFGPLVFERAEALYKEHAPVLSGMILEMEYDSLKRVVSDSGLLDEAISKAHSAIVARDQCLAS